LLVALDGPAGAGKSTVARELARELGFAYLDSGAMYRCVALLCLRSPAQDAAALARAASIQIAPGTTVADVRVSLDGEDVTQAIRAPEVSEAASRVAASGEVREILVGKQRELLASGDWVAEGRDIGTVVAPAAEVKVFLTADPGERARRRAEQIGADESTVLAEQAMRDQRDATREHSPLRAADGAVVLDSTGRSVEQVVAQIAQLVARAGARP
jgi:cytidylate kinase